MLLLFLYIIFCCKTLVHHIYLKNSPTQEAATI